VHLRAGRYAPRGVESRPIFGSGRDVSAFELLIEPCERNERCLCRPSSLAHGEPGNRWWHLTTKHAVGHLVRSVNLVLWSVQKFIILTYGITSLC
jgi:hypothetical protein